MKNHNRYVIIALLTLAVVAAAVAALYWKSANSPQPGPDTQPISYTITKPDIVCDMSLPPQCSGTLSLTSENAGETQVGIDGNSKVRYEKREVQVYPDSLREGMTVTVTLRGDYTIADEVVITE